MEFASANLRGAASFLCSAANFRKLHHFTCTAPLPDDCAVSGPCVQPQCLCPGIQQALCNCLTTALCSKMQRCASHVGRTLFVSTSIQQALHNFPVALVCSLTLSTVSLSAPHPASTAQLPDDLVVQQYSVMCVVGWSPCLCHHWHPARSSQFSNGRLSKHIQWCHMAVSVSSIGFLDKHLGGACAVLDRIC